MSFFFFFSVNDLEINLRHDGAVPKPYTNTYSALCILSVSVLLLSASVLVKASEMPAAGTGGGLAGATGVPGKGLQEGPQGRGEGKPPSALRSTGQNWGPSPPSSPSNWVLTCPGQGIETSSLPSPPASGGFYIFQLGQRRPLRASLLLGVAPSCVCFDSPKQ